MAHFGNEKGNSCSICNGKKIRSLIQINNMPVHSNLLWSTKENAVRTPRGDINLSYCENCGHIFNQSLDPTKLDYSDTYENALYFSSTFQDYVQDLADYLINKYELHNKEIIDIGCGQGYFLSMLCQNGNNRGYGFDPSFRFKGQDLDHPGNVSFIRDYYSSRYSNFKADLIVCRQVLEHILDPVEFIRMVRNALKDKDSFIFFEVPNAGYMLDELSFWDIIYEHKSYFSKKSFEMLFTENAFSVFRVSELYDQQYLGLEAGTSALKKNGSTYMDESFTNDIIDYFENQFNEKVNHWKKTINIWNEKGERTILWGAGSKGMTFLNVINPTDSFEYAIDVNPRKQGKFLNGSGQEIMSPDFLKTYRPQHILIMNPIYEDEIREMISGFGINSQVEIV